MLRVSIHAGPLASASRYNRLDWVDIAYERLAPVADYRAVLFTAGAGARPQVIVRNYPRWSASLFDLAARAIALSLSPEGAPSEDAPPFEPGGRRAAFASAMCATIEHLPSDNDNRHVTLATVDIAQYRRCRRWYTARFTEDTMGAYTTKPFSFAPKVLQPAELFLRAALVRLTGDQQQMPPRPMLCVPFPWEENGKRYVPVHRLVEPARTGFMRWLERFSEPPEPRVGAPDGIAPEPAYGLFLAQAI